MSAGAFIAGAAAGAGLLLLTSKKDCYAQKSKDYDKCREIPPSDYELRQGCFVEADKRLKECLGGGSVSGFWEDVEKKIADTESDLKARAEAAARAGATKETSKFWTTAAWVGVVGLGAYILLRR